MKFPSLNNSNKLTWKCKIFGCRNEQHPLLWQENGERHGVKGWGRITAIGTLITYIFMGCRWCQNYTKIKAEEDDCYYGPWWECSCDVCDKITPP